METVIKLAISIAITGILFLCVILPIRLGKWTVKNPDLPLTQKINYIMDKLLPIFLFIVLTLTVFSLLT